VLDKIIVSTRIYWDTYPAAAGTTVPPPLALLLRRRWHHCSAAVGTAALPLHLFDGSAVIIFHVCLQMGYVMSRTHY
jgi:hypothetical protein